MTQRSPDDFKDELDAHLALEADALREEGLPDEAAAAAAKRALGNRTQIEERFHERLHWRPWSELRQDVRQALRLLRRSPRFAVAAVATLALGVGANTALTGAIDEILWSPLDVPRADELVVVHTIDRRDGRYPPVSIPDYEDLRQRIVSLSGLAGYTRAERRLDFGGERVMVGSESVTPNYFDVLEVRPVLGRAFEAADNAGPGGRPVVMLSEALWTTRFGRDRGIVGRRLVIEGEPFEVIGVVPATYGRAHNVFWISPPEIWLPVATLARFLEPGRGEVLFRTRGAGLLGVLFGRLASGVTARQAQAEIETVVSAMPRERGSLAGSGVLVVPAGHAKFYPGYRRAFGQRLAIVGLIGVVVLVLACSNLANLLLERTTRRRQELALRSSLGAGRARLVRQLLTESLVLGVPGFLVSLLVAYALLRLLSAYPLALGVPLMLDLHVTNRIVLLCFLTSVAVVLTFSLMPVLSATRRNLAAIAVSRDVSRRSRLAYGLVAVQVALSAVLLAGTLLILRTITAAHDMDLGFQVERLVGLEQQRSSSFRGEQETVPDGILDPERWGVPGLAAVALASPSPLYGWTSPARIRDASVPSSSPVESDEIRATSGFFDVMQMPLVQGREFRPGEGIDPVKDRAGRNAAPVVILSRDLADRLWSGQSAVGRFVIGSWSKEPAEVVGVVADARYVNLWHAPRPTVYRPFAPTSSWGGEILIRTTVPPGVLLPQIERAWRAMSPDLGASVRAGDTYVFDAAASQRLMSRLVAVFAALALVVASIGLYSAMAWFVERRRREIAVRIAIGGSPAAIARRIVAHAGIVSASGAVLGLGVAVAFAPQLDALTRAAASFDAMSVPAAAPPYDVVAFAVAAAGLALVCLSAAAIPAARAARVDPAEVLKGE